MKHLWIILFSALVGVCGCFPQAKNPMLVSDVSSFYLDDTIRQAKRVGMDYRPTLDAALDNDTQALQRLFELTSSGALEGRGADSHAAMLWTLLTQWGDQNFSKALNIEPAGTRQAVITYLDYAAAANYSKHYPLTYAMGSHQVRYSGG